jgi:hypothetical protein
MCASGSENFQNWRRIGSYFFPAKNLGRWPCQDLNGWIVCRFHGARGGAPEGERKAITGTVPEPRPPSSFGASSNR